MVQALIQSEWQTEALVDSYLEDIRGAIPGADLQLAVIKKLVQSWCNMPSRILDLGCGDGILGRFLLEIFSQKESSSLHAVFVDFSDPMLDALRAKVKNMPQTSILKADFSSSLWLDSVNGFKPFDIVVSGFSIHHQPDSRKKSLYAEIYELLSPNGLFLNQEHVLSPTPAIEKIYDEFFIDNLYEYKPGPENDKVSRKSIADDYYSRPDKTENILASVEQQCHWLREIGFQDVDCFFKTFELALFGGRKKT